MQLTAQRKRELSLGRRIYDLSQFGILYAEEMSDVSVEGRRKVIIKLTARAQVLARDARLDPLPWHYSLPEHTALLRVLRQETLELAEIEQEQDVTPSKLDAIKASYEEARRDSVGRLPPWSALTYDMAQAFIHVYCDGRQDATDEFYARMTEQIDSRTEERAA